MKGFLCHYCGEFSISKIAFKRHVFSKHGDGVTCEICQEKFSRTDNLLRHQRRFHSPSSNDSIVQLTNLLPNPPIPSTSRNIIIKRCEICKLDILISGWSYHLRTSSHKKNAKEPLNEVLNVLKSGFGERIETYILENKDESNLNPIAFMQESEKPILEALENLLEKHSSIKFNIELFGEYIKMKKSGDDEEDLEINIKSFQSKMKAVLSKEELKGVLQSLFDVINTKMQEFQERDSGWTLIRINHLEININQYKPIKGSSYIPLPFSIRKKGACINVQNSDEYCFKWAIISALFPIEKGNRSRPSSYNVPNIEESIIFLNNNVKLDFSSLMFPVKVCDVEKFEQLNNEISVNVFGYEAFDNNSFKIIGPYYCTKAEKKNHINLLLLISEEKSHYVWIKNISR